MKMVKLYMSHIKYLFFMKKLLILFLILLGTSSRGAIYSSYPITNSLQLTDSILLLANNNLYRATIATVRGNDSWTNLGGVLYPSPAVDVVNMTNAVVNTIGIDDLQAAGGYTILNDIILNSGTTPSLPYLYALNVENRATNGFNDGTALFGQFASYAIEGFVGAGVGTFLPSSAAIGVEGYAFGDYALQIGVGGTALNDNSGGQTSIGVSGVSVTSNQTNGTNVGGYFAVSKTDNTTPTVIQSVVQLENNDTDVPLLVGSTQNGTVLLNFYPSIASSGSAVAYLFDTSNVLTNGDKIATFGNAGTNIALIGSNGELFLGKGGIEDFPVVNDSIYSYRDVSLGETVANKLILGTKDSDSFNYFSEARLETSLSSTNNPVSSITLENLGAGGDYSVGELRVAAGGEQWLAFSSPPATLMWLRPTVASSGSSTAYLFDSSNILTNGDAIVTFNNTTIPHLQVAPSSTAKDTSLLLLDVDSASLKRVSVGANDSGGAGFKVLRVAN